MAVESPQISIDPYRSQVPLVQIPQMDLQAAQTPGAIYSKGGGIATMADGVMKGMLKGLQMKEEKKYKTAEAVMNAQDASISAADKNYQNLLITKGADSEETKAAWASKVALVNQAADQREAYAIPKKETGTKSQKKEQGAKDKAAGIPVQGGFGDHVKHFLSRNPQILPQLAIMGMRSQVDPKLYGQMTPELTQQKQQYDAAQRQEANQKVTDAATATRNKYAGKKNLTPEQQEEYDNAVAVLTPIAKTSAKTRVINEIGKPEIQHVIRDDEDVPPGYEVHERPLAGSVPKEGTPQAFTTNALKGWGVNDKTPPGMKAKYELFAKALWDHRAAQTTSTSSEHLDTDPVTNRRVAVTTNSSNTRGAAMPKPQDFGLPADTPLPGEDGLPQKKESSPKTDESPKPGGRMTAAPSSQAASPSTGKGAMTPAPSRSGIRDTGMKSMQGAQNTQKVETEERAAYEKANTVYQAALKNNKAKAPDAASLEKANAEALGAFNAAKAQIVLWKVKQIEAVGGDPWKAQAKGQDGNTYATMDGTNWVNIKTGYPYQEQ